MTTATYLLTYKEEEEDEQVKVKEEDEGENKTEKEDEEKPARVKPNLVSILPNSVEQRTLLTASPSDMNSPGNRAHCYAEIVVSSLQACP